MLNDVNSNEVYEKLILNVSLNTIQSKIKKMNKNNTDIIKIYAIDIGIFSKLSVILVVPYLLKYSKLFKTLIFISLPHS